MHSGIERPKVKVRVKVSDGLKGFGMCFGISFLEDSHSGTAGFSVTRCS